MKSEPQALIGIAFALGFTVGPAMGAYFSTLDLVHWHDSLESYGFHPYSAPASLAFGLILLEIFYLYYSLPETHVRNNSPDKKINSTSSSSTISHQSYRQLHRLSWFHFLYLLVFSGMEFTLPFLTYDQFGFTNLQQGKLFGFIGCITALVQGGYTRRFANRLGERRLVFQGLCTCAVGFFILGRWSHNMWVLWLAAACIAFTSGTVVTGLTALASHQCGHALDAGQGMGMFRSWGQLGRAFGPILACCLYWMWGSRWTYFTGTGALIFLMTSIRSIIPRGRVSDVVDSKERKLK